MLRMEVAIQQSGIRALDETTRNVGLYEAAQGRVAARSHGRRDFDRLRRSRVSQNRPCETDCFFAAASVVL
jgi:hypothetical protein